MTTTELTAQPTGTDLSAGVESVLLRGEALGFVSRALADKMDLLREYRRLDTECGLLRPSNRCRGPGSVQATHPLICGYAALLLASKDEDNTPSSRASLIKAAQDRLDSIDRKVADLSRELMGYQMRLLELRRKDGQTGDAKTDDDIIREAKALGISFEGDEDD